MFDFDQYNIMFRPHDFNGFTHVSTEHTRATEFPRVWVWVGYPQLTIYPIQPKNSGQPIF